MRFTIDLIPRTKKNSQRIIRDGSGRIRVFPSQAYKMYESEAYYFLPKVEEPISHPVNVKAIFYMPTHRRVDLVNLEECLCDVLVHYGILEDDNCRIIQSMDGSRVEYDKNNPRTEVEITEIKDG